MTNYQTIAVVYGRAWVDTVLAAYKTVPGGALIVTGKVRLSKDPAFNPTPSSKIADLTPNEADFSGYTAGGDAVVLSAPLNVTTVIQGVLTSALFIAAVATPFVGNTVSGYWIDDGTNVVAAERFAGGLTSAFGAPGDFLDLEVMLPFNLEQATS